MKQTALVIVDMQEDFCLPMTEGYSYDGSGPKVTRNLQDEWWKRTNRILEAIIHAKRNRWHIIVLEYKNFGPTIYDIMDEIGDYPFELFTKNQDSGAYKLRPYLNKNRINRVYLVGCNSESCVYDTFTDLAYYSENIRTKVYLPATLTFNYGKSNNTNGFMSRMFGSDAALKLA